MNIMAVIDINGNKNVYDIEKVLGNLMILLDKEMSESDTNKIQKLDCLIELVKTRIELIKSIGDENKDLPDNLFYCLFKKPIMELEDELHEYELMKEKNTKEQIIKDAERIKAADQIQSLKNLLETKGEDILKKVLKDGVELPLIYDTSIFQKKINDMQMGLFRDISKTYSGGFFR